MNNEPISLDSYRITDADALEELLIELDEPTCTVELTLSEVEFIEKLGQALMAAPFSAQRPALDLMTIALKGRAAFKLREAMP